MAVSFLNRLVKLDSLLPPTTKPTMSLPFCLPLRWKKSVNYKQGKRKSMSITQSTLVRFCSSRVGPVRPGPIRIPDPSRAVGRPRQQKAGKSGKQTTTGLWRSWP